MKFNTIKRRLLVATAISVAVIMPSAAVAQGESDTASDAEVSDDGEFLGELTLGQSKREVQTGTATPITSIKQEEIDDRQANTIGELIDTVPGVNLINGTTPLGSGVNIRGFGGNSTFGTDQKVAIVVDGATTGAEEIYRFGGTLFTDPNLYKQVDVIRGTVGSYEYGSGIIGGTVLLVTKDASDFTGGEVGFNVGLNGSIYTNESGLSTSIIGAWQPTENLEIIGNFAYREQDEATAGNGTTIPATDFELPSYFVKGRYTAGSHSFVASYNLTETSEIDVPLETFSGLAGFFGNVDRDVTSEVIQGQYYFSPESDLIDLELGASYSNQEIVQQLNVTTIPFGFAGLANADHQFEITKFYAKNRPYFETGGLEHNMVLGAEIQIRERENAFAAPGGTDDRFAVYAIDEIAVTDALTITPAIRYETSELELDTPNAVLGADISNEALSGGVSGRYDFGNGLALFSSFAYTEGLPILDDAGNDILLERNETAETIELGGSYDRIGLFSENDRLAVKLNYYDTQVDDLTTLRGVVGVELEGIELEASLAFENGIYFDVNGNWVDQKELASPDDDIANPVQDFVVDFRQEPQDSIRASVG